MSTDTNDFLAIYVEEIAELLADVDASVNALRTNPGDEDAARFLHRVAHTLKTSAGILGFEATRGYAAAVEKLLTPAWQGNAPVAPDLHVTLEDAFAFIKRIQAQIEATGAEDSAPIRAKTADINALQARLAT